MEVFEEKISLEEKNMQEVKTVSDLQQTIKHLKAQQQNEFKIAPPVTFASLTQPSHQQQQHQQQQ